MKSYYYFTTDKEFFTPKTVYLKVSCGASFKEVTKLALVREYCAQLGYYFEKVDFNSDLFIEHKAALLHKGSNLPCLYINSDSINIGMLYSLIIRGDLDSFLLRVRMKPISTKFLSTYDSDYFFSHFKPKGKNVLPSAKDKYLSDKHKEESALAVTGSILLFIIFLLDGLLGNLLGIQ